MPVIVIRLFVHDAFEQRARVGETPLPHEALAEMCAGINIARVAFQRGAIGRLGLVEFSALKINIAQLEVMVGVVEVMNLRL